jgi:hypothetical protein
MEIKERIKKISEYFKEMQIVSVEGKQIIYITVDFPQGWIIDESLETKYNITIERGNYPTEYYFFAEIDTGENVIFDAIEDNIKKMKNAIERGKLLKLKVTELTKLFQDESISLDKLRGLKFTWDEDILLEDTIEGHIFISDNNDISGISVSNCQDTTTNKEVEKQYTTEIKNNKKSKK